MSDYAYEIAYLTRQLDQMEARDLTLASGAHSAYPVKSFADERLRVRAYYLESCLTALASPDMLIGLRAAFQAFAYSGQDWGKPSLQALYPGERDFLIAIRNRFECLMPYPSTPDRKCDAQLPLQLGEGAQ